MSKHWKTIAIIILVIASVLNIILKISKVSPFMNQVKTVIVAEEQKQKEQYNLETEKEGEKQAQTQDIKQEEKEGNIHIEEIDTPVFPE